jgi:hypothetical protein
MNCTETERPDMYPLDSVCVYRPLEFRRPRTLSEATREQEEDRAPVQPPQRESKCARG